MGDVRWVDAGMNGAALRSQFPRGQVHLPVFVSLHLQGFHVGILYYSYEFFTCTNDSMNYTRICHYLSRTRVAGWKHNMVVFDLHIRVAAHIWFRSGKRHFRQSLYIPCLSCFTILIGFL